MPVLKYAKGFQYISACRQLFNKKLLLLARPNEYDTFGQISFGYSVERSPIVHFSIYLSVNTTMIAS